MGNDGKKGADKQRITLTTLIITVLQKHRLTLDDWSKSFNALKTEGAFSSGWALFISSVGGKDLNESPELMRGLKEVDEILTSGIFPEGFFQYTVGSNPSVIHFNVKALTLVIDFYLEQKKLGREALAHFAGHLRALSGTWENFDFFNDHDLEVFLVASLTTSPWSEAARPLLEAYLDRSPDVYDKLINHLDARLTASPDQRDVKAVPYVENAPFVEALVEFFKRTTHISRRALIFLQALVQDEKAENPRYPQVSFEKPSVESSIKKALERFESRQRGRDIEILGRALAQDPTMSPQDKKSVMAAVDAQLADLLIDDVGALVRGAPNDPLSPQARRAQRAQENMKSFVDELFAAYHAAGGTANSPAEIAEQTAEMFRNEMSAEPHHESVVADAAVVVVDKFTWEKGRAQVVGYLNQALGEARVRGAKKVLVTVPSSGIVDHLKSLFPNLEIVSVDRAFKTEGNIETVSIPDLKSSLQGLSSIIVVGAQQENLRWIGDEETMLALINAATHVTHCLQSLQEQMIEAIKVQMMA